MIRKLLPLPAVAVLLAVCGTHDLLAALAQDYPIEVFGWAIASEQVQSFVYRIRHDRRIDHIIEQGLKHDVVGIGHGRVGLVLAHGPPAVVGTRTRKSASVRSHARASWL